MKKQHIALVLDKSSSMSDTKAHTISGFNEQVAQIKLNAKDAPYETTVTLVTFNGDVFEHLLMASVDQLEEADPEFYQCEGATAMFDGMGYAAKKISEAMGPEDDALLITISDGDENASKHYNAGSLKELLDGLQATKRWTISYMGCGADSLSKVARQTGIPVSNMAAWRNDQAGSSKRAMSGTAAAIGRYMQSKSVDPSKHLEEDFYIPIRPPGTESKEIFMDFASSADGAAVSMAEAVASEDGVHLSKSMSFASFAPASLARGGPEALGVACSLAPQAPVVDRPEDLELRVGKSDVFGKGNKASW